MKILGAMLVGGWLVASFGMAETWAKGPPGPPPQPNPLQMLAASVAALQSEVAALQATVSSQAATISSLQAELAGTAAQNAFALGNYVTVDTTDATLKGVKAPNIIFSGANVHIVSGSGMTVDTTGLGNLVIGYDDDTGHTSIDAARNGSHNLILGDYNTFTSNGGLVAGKYNAISAEYASVSGGDNEHRERLWHHRRRRIQPDCLGQRPYPSRPYRLRAMITTVGNG
jgi:hypothetical protein